MLWIAQAFAAEREVGIELHVLPRMDGPGEEVGMGRAVTLPSARVAWPLMEHVSLLGTIGVSSTSGALVVPGFSEELRSTWTGGLLGVGAKAGWQFGEWFELYGTAQGLGMLQDVRSDDDPEDDQNLTQAASVGLTGGLQGTLGATIRIPMGESRYAASIYGELGGDWLAPAPIGDLGAIHYGGVTGRIGTGFRF